MVDPVKMVSAASAEAQQAETQAAGFFSQTKPLWWVFVAAALGLAIGWVL